jgi:hypothetical protein
MIHGPCQRNKDATCMKNFMTCSRHFPRPHMEKTVIDENNYPSYRRRANGFSTTSKDPLNRRGRITVGNEWVVPYNPYLSKKYKAHTDLPPLPFIRANRAHVTFSTTYSPFLHFALTVRLTGAHSIRSLLSLTLALHQYLSRPIS